MIYSFAGYLGVNCVLNLVRHFGALIAVTGLFAYKNKLNFCKILFFSYHISKDNYSYSLIYCFYKAIYFSVIFFVLFEFRIHFRLDIYGPVPL
jgi:hypothetical protein